MDEADAWLAGELDRGNAKQATTHSCVGAWGPGLAQERGILCTANSLGAPLAWLLVVLVCTKFVLAQTCIDSSMSQPTDLEAVLTWP